MNDKHQFKKDLFLKIYDDEKNRNHSLTSKQRRKIVEEVIQLNMMIEEEQVSILDISYESEDHNESI